MTDEINYQVDRSKFQELIDSLCAQASQFLQSKYASIWLRRGGQIQLSAATGYAEGLDFSEMFYEEGEGLTGYIAQGNPYRGTFRDIRGDTRWKGKFDHIQWPDPETSDLTAFLGVPIFLDRSCIGVLKVENKEGNIPYSEEDQTLLETMARLIETAIKSHPDLLGEVLGPYIFVLIPFSDDFRDVYDLGIKAAATMLDCRCERVDELEFNDDILQHIYQEIRNANLIVADMTGRNPNVFYEVGYAHALQKEIILLTQDAKDIPFDLKGHNHIVYEGKVRKLKDALSKRLEAILHNKSIHRTTLTAGR